MGGIGSKYRFQALSELEYDKNKSKAEQEFPWIVTARSKLLLKEDAFENVAGLGRGKYGTVFLSRQVNSNKYVAIKYISKQVVYQNKCIKKIQQEMNVLQALSHPFAIRCLGGYITQGSLALLFEYAFGGELYHRMKTVNKMSEDEAKFYFCEICSVLKYLHEDCNIVFRDLKPENILLDYEGHIKVCDFGFAVEHLNDSGDPVFDLRDGCGTIMYMSPEIACGKYTHAFPCDWWSLGVVLMEMITGQAPFGDTENMGKFEIFTNISEKTILLPVFMSWSLRKLLKGLLTRDPNKRWSWKEVSQSPWLKNVQWGVVNVRRLKPPWVPKGASPGSTENFVNWHLSVPSKPDDHAVEDYCADVKLPVFKQDGASNNLLNVTPRADLGRRKNSASTLATQQSFQRMPSRKGSSGALTLLDDSHPNAQQPSFQKALSRKMSINNGLSVDDKIESKPTRKNSMSKESNQLTHFGTLPVSPSNEHSPPHTPSGGSVPQLEKRLSKISTIPLSSGNRSPSRVLPSS